VAAGSVVEAGEGTAEGCSRTSGRQAAPGFSVAIRPSPYGIAMRRSVSDTPASPAPAWHAMSVDEAATRLATDRRHGLTADEAARRLERHGPNAVTPRKSQGPVARFLLQFHQALVYILVVAAAVALALGEHVDSGVIFGVVLVNAVIGFIQETKALRAIDALSKSLRMKATVIREGERRLLDAADLVPGDVVVVASGDRAPADLRLAEARDLHADESALTGEALPVSKGAEPLALETALADRRSMLYGSTLITRGHGTGLVVATGDKTEVGRISSLIGQAEQLQTPLLRKIAAFSRLLLVVILAIAAVTFVVGVLRGQSAVDMFMAAVALAVGAIPEGLPAAMTIMLAVGVSRMARRRAIVRRLPAVEALGSVTVICSDKTGTLTQNQMTVQEIVAGGERFEVTGAGYEPAGEIRRDGQLIDPADYPALVECLRAGALCNDASLARIEGGWQAQGDPTEAALLVSAHKAGMTEECLEEQWERIDEIPFESDRQYMATLHRARGAQREAVIYLKGSVERTLGQCSEQCDRDCRPAPLDTDSALAAAAEMSRRGYRVLAMARAPEPEGTAEITHDMLPGRLVLLGMQAMLDPPRPEAIRAIANCRAAGIEVKMITGDHALTAASVARLIGLGDEPGAVADLGAITRAEVAKVVIAGDHALTAASVTRLIGLGGEPGAGAALRAITSAEMAKVADEDLPRLASATAVFARMTPEQKLRLVKALQQSGEIVAMTGDGVNDAPALRQADVGVAMGQSGTEAAKDAADMVLADDNFASIEAAVEEGRAVYSNLTKFIAWTLPTNGGEALIILSAVLFGSSLPILPAQLLYVNMTTALLLGMPLVFEPKERDIMARPPNDPRQGILTFALFMRLGLVSLLLMIGGFGLFQWELSHDASIAKARTVAVSVVVIGELFYLFNCRSLTQTMFKVGVFSNPILLGGAAAMIAVQVGYAHLPFMQTLFGSAPLDLAAWGRVFAVGFAISLIVGFEKWVRRALTGAEMKNDEW
jgi:cation-transporting ATPase F